MGHRSKIEDGMGFAGLVPSAAERAQERQIKVAIAAAKRDLAEKVLAVIEREERNRFGEGATGISSAVRNFFADSGIELTTPQQQEGE